MRFLPGVLLVLALTACGQSAASPSNPPSVKEPINWSVPGPARPQATPYPFETLPPLPDGAFVAYCDDPAVKAAQEEVVAAEDDQWITMRVDEAFGTPNPSRPTGGWRKRSLWCALRRSPRHRRG